MGVIEDAVKGVWRSITGSGNKKKEKKQKAPVVPPVVEIPKEIEQKQAVATQEADAKNAALEARKTAAALKGRRATILTGALGVKDGATTKKKTLLGQ